MYFVRSLLRVLHVYRDAIRVLCFCAGTAHACYRVGGLQAARVPKESLRLESPNVSPGLRRLQW